MRHDRQDGVGNEQVGPVHHADAVAAIEASVGLAVFGSGGARVGWLLGQESCGRGHPGGTRVALANDHLVLAHVSRRMRKRFIRLTIGDRVKMEMSPYDTAKARIVYRLA